MGTINMQVAENHLKRGLYLHVMDFHIGKKINEVRKLRGMQTTTLAKKVNRSREALYDIYNRNTIDTDLLKDICEALQYNFFNDLLKLPLVDRWNQANEQTNTVQEAGSNYNTDYREKYFSALEELNSLRKEKEQSAKQSEHSLQRTLRAGFARTVAALELTIENLAEIQKKSVPEVKAAWGIKTSDLLKDSL